jgi:peptidyl-prolyl cis-trans isomerase A (cyclophilin A)
MQIRLALLAAALAVPAFAQTPPPPPAAPAPKALVHVTLTTTEGIIVLALEKERAPITTANFLHYVDTRRFDGIAFYRAMRFTPTAGLIQAGLRNDPKKLFPPIKLEPTSQTGLSHVNGTISMARAAPDSATADFFITCEPMLSLDAKTGGDAGFAAFGHVEQGMDVVLRILNQPAGNDPAVPAMNGQMLTAPVKILTARRSNSPID